jgi:hypothetical protein
MSVAPLKLTRNLTFNVLPAVKIISSPSLSTSVDSTPDRTEWSTPIPETSLR